MRSTCKIVHLNCWTVMGRPRLRFPVANILPTDKCLIEPPLHKYQTIHWTPATTVRQSLCLLLWHLAFVGRAVVSPLQRDPFFVSRSLFFPCLIFFHRLHEAPPLLSSSLPRQDSLGAIVAVGDLCGKMGQRALRGSLFFFNGVMVQSALKTMMRRRGRGVF